MAENNSVDLEGLRQKVSAGATAEELMREMEFPDAMILSQALLHLLRDGTEGRKQEVAEAIGKKYAVNPKYEVEGIVIRPKMLRNTPFQEGDEFEFRVEGDDRIVLKRVAVESVGPL